MLARDLAEDYPLVGLDTDALEAARILAEQRLPGLVVVDSRHAPHAILPASQVVRFVIPAYVREDPSLARVISEATADQIAHRLAGRRVADLLPDEPHRLPVVAGDDTVLELGALMARLRSPLVAVVDGDRVTGVVTAARLLALGCGAA